MDIIFDIDGTLMDISHRVRFLKQDPKDWKSFRNETFQDSPNEDVFAVAEALSRAGHRLLIATGRKESQREITRSQLVEGAGEPDSGFQFEKLYMRSNEDDREDFILKREMLGAMRAEGYDPVMAFEDRSQVINMWRELGLRAFQVASGGWDQSSTASNEKLSFKESILKAKRSVRQ